ncbi:hypothetical protein OF83DRAFT_1262061 [Amylostereum chailletii]|nr:hypothetical protein OF83DRAFT_1262061 [Amylostereum chailletii]
MKILHRSKRALPPLPQVAELINKLIDTPNDDLHEVLSEIDAWKWPRSDLNAWIKVLNKFDAILEEIIRDYDVDKLQINPFTPLNKKTACEILRFERLLLENSTNRKTFASYDRINSLLSTSDLDVLVLALNLLLRPAQQYSAQPAVSRALSISTPRLHALAKRWSGLREYGVNLLDLVTEGGKQQVHDLPVEAREVQFTFYKTTKPEAGKDQPKDMDVDAPESSQTPVRRTTSSAPVPTPAPASSTQSSGAVAIHIEADTLQKKSTMQVLADCMEAHSLPEDDKFDLMCRIRTAQVLTPGHEEDREKLVIVRLLATAIFVHTHSDGQTSSSLFLYEPDLIPHIAELLTLDRGIPIPVQTAAVSALDAMSRYRSRVQDVLSAVNAGVNHGTLMALMRKTVSDAAHPESAIPHSFIEALLSFVTYLASHAAGGNMVVGAGLIPLLIQIIENKLPQRLPMVSKAMQLVDNVLYSFQNAFQLFCNNRGVDVLVDRIAHEVDDDIKVFGSEERYQEVPRSYGQLPVVRSATLKHVLRSMHRMMQSSGTTEGLRGLIDSSLPKSIKKIMEHRALFGPNVLPISINIMATFVHNEPTSLSIIQEQGLPETFYKTIEAGLEPVIEVIQAIPNAIGALCLNQAGQDQLSARPTIIPGLFSIFTSERHQRVLQDKENAVLIGAAVDELIRHHPSLKVAVFEAIKSTMSKIEDLGSGYVPPENIKSWYKLVQLSATAPSQPIADDDVQMAPAEASAQSGGQILLDQPAEDSNNDEESKAKSHENIIVSFMDVIFRFLEGLFQHPPHCKDFITTFGGLERIGHMTALPCLPYDFANSVASDSLVQIVRTMFDTSPNVTMGHLMDIVKLSLADTKDFWADLKSGSKLMALLDPVAHAEGTGDELFRKLIALNIRIMLLSDVYTTVGFAHGRPSAGLLQAIVSKSGPDVLPDLGALHRACIWENVQLKSTAPPPASDVPANPSEMPTVVSPDSSSVSLPEEPSTTNGVQDGAITPSGTPAEGDAGAQENDQDAGPRALRHLATQIPGALTPFFQAIVKLFSTRRHPDDVQKQNIKDTGVRLAGVLLNHLQPVDFDDRLAIIQYYTGLLGLVTTFMVDERSTSATLHTILLNSFYRNGGVDALIFVCRRFMAIVEEVNTIKESERSEALTHEISNAFGGIKVALHFLHPVVSTKPIFESPQTTLLINREKKEGDPDYFEPHNFLVKLRLAILPLIRDLWTASWLVSAPSGLIRSVVQVILEIVGGEGEEGQTDIAADPTPVGGGLSFRSHVPDETRIQQVTEMGFPRWAAERALARTQNNVNAATELLLANPFRFHQPPPPAAEPAVPVPDTTAMDEDTPAASGDNTPAPEVTAEAVNDTVTPDAEPTSTEDPAPAEAEMEAEVETEAGTRPAADAEPHPEGPKEPVKTAEQWREELNAAREPLKVDIGSLALRLVDEHPSLIFDVHNAFIGRVDGFQKESIKLLIRDVKAFSPHAHDVQEQPLAVRCRLLALVLNEAPTSFSPVIAGEEKEFMDVLLALLLSHPLSAEGDRPVVPKWLAASLLVSEALLTMGDDIRPITLPKEGDAVDTQEIFVGPHYPEARIVLFDFCMRLLALPGLPRDDLLSSLRLLVIITRDHSMALEFVKRGGVQLLFQSLKSSTGGVGGSQSYITIILRHVIEDPSTVRSIMRQEVQRFLSHPRSRVVDVPTYVRASNALALRDSKAFLEVTDSLARLDRPFSVPNHIMLKDDVAAATKKTDLEPYPDALLNAPMLVDQPVLGSLSSPPEYLESVVHFLIGELMTSIKPPSSQATENTASGAGSSGISVLTGAQASSSTDTPKDATAHPQDSLDFYYCGFLMQCLTELLFSYDSCKVAFLSYSPKKKSTSLPKETPSKHRNVALQFLLSEIITFGTLNSESGPDSRKRIHLCNWAMSVIVALCVDTATTPDSKDVSPELVSVRKFVLEGVSRAIKDPYPSDSVDARYGRLLALADLCLRLLTVRFNVSSNARKPVEDVPTHLAKIMLEKNFVATLTNALAEVDLNFPNVRGLVASVLKPLELLSKIAIKMSRASDKTKGPEDAKIEGEDENMSDEEDEDDERSNREETPDLYRNSSLGMFGGEMEDQFADEDMDEDEGEEDEDVEMDFGEGTGSEDTSEESDVGEDDEDAMGESGDEGEGWQDEDEDEDEDNLVEEEEAHAHTHVEEADEDDGDEEDDDDEALWENMAASGEAMANMMGEEGDDDEGEVGLPTFQADGEEDGGMGSDDELDAELRMLDGQEGPGDIFRFTPGIPEGLPGFMGTHAGGNIVITGGLHAPRLRADGDDDMEIFGRPRGAQPVENVTHPPLIEEPALPGGQSSGQGRSNRRGGRSFFGASGTQQDILQAIEDVIGGSAVQLFQHIITRRGGGNGGTETIRLDVPAGTLVNLDRGGLGRRGGPISTSLHIQRPSRTETRPEGREFDPFLTVQRWGEESKVVNGKFAPDRFSRLGNHVVLQLLPAAIKKAEEDRQAAEEAQRQAEVEAREEEETRRKEEEAKATEEAARVEREREEAAAAAEAAPAVSGDVAPEGLVGDVEMADAPAASPGEELASAESSTSGAGEASTSAPPERVTVMIHGSPVDITDTGIDPTFLEALPDDMREEVVNQHIRDQRAARVERPPDSQISAEFLDALPPEIRAEIIQQERIEQARRREEERQAAQAAAGGGAVDIDPASFIASLDPQLRQEVLMEQDDGFIQALPSHMIAEAGIYREGAPRRPLPPTLPPARVPPGQATPPHKAAPPRDAIQLLDKTGVAVLVRLLFFPQILKKSVLFKVLVNLCENSKTRTELFNLLLNILQDGTADLAAVDRSFAQMTFRHPKTPTQTPRAAGKQKAGIDYLSSLPVSHLPGEVVPDLIAQRCLEALSYIVTANEHSSLFFLTEHEIPIGLRRGASKKGKGKEKQTSHTQYLIVLLLGLLDRQSLLKTPSILESVVSLLDTVTRPLTSLKDAQKKSDEEVPKEAASSSTTAPSGTDAPVPSSEDPATAPAPLESSAPGETDIICAVRWIDISLTAPSSGQPVIAAPTDTVLTGASVEEKILLANPPQIPHAVLRFIVNILTVGECGAKPFHHSLALIQHLSYVPDAREIIAQELRIKAQDFGLSLNQDLDELVNGLNGADGDVLASSVASKFSSPSSDQAKLLRVLKTIDYMYSPKPNTPAEAQPTSDVEKMQGIHESFRFTPLWRRLGDCLSIIEQRPEIEHIATVLLPLIESLMVVCKYVGSTSTTSAARALRSSASPRSPTTPRESMEDLFVSFTDAHRKVLNVMVRNNPSLMSGSFSLLVHNPRVLDFDNKRNYFSQQLHRRPHVREHYGTLQLNVRRQRVFEDSFQYLQRKTGDQIKYGKLSVRFYDEEGVDAGGVTREWFQILARQMFDPNNALFEPCAADKLTYQPNKASWVNPEHLSFFKFVGRVIGKAIYDNRLLDAYFARSLYRQILNKPVDYRDVEWIDPEYYKSLCWILENDPSPLDLTFSVEGDEFGVMKMVELKPNGHHIPVTLENRREFVQLSAQYRLYESIKDQLENLLAGFYEIIPKDLVSIFNEQELELLISGTPDIDVDEWRAATEYNGYTSSDPVIVWWWRALKSFNRDERAKLLSFATGTSRVPLNGFGDLQGVQGTQRFSIHRAYGDADRLPQAHTCFNQIDLPQYSSYEMLRQQLLLAINEGAEGFGFA